jgi:hypothetical protein
VLWPSWSGCVIRANRQLHDDLFDFFYQALPGYEAQDDQ